MSRSPNGQTDPPVDPAAEAVAGRLEALAVDHLAEQVGVPRSLLSRDSDVTRLGLSSAQVTELVYMVEDELGIVLTDGDLVSVTTVGHLVDLAVAVAVAGSEPNGSS
jgi:acyl carrier protein